MNDFLQDMQSLTLYKHMTSLKDQSKSTLLNPTDEVQLEMVKYKNAIAKNAEAPKVNTVAYHDYSSITEIAKSTSINATTSVKDTLAQNGAFNQAPSGASAMTGSVQGGGAVGGSVGSSLAAYSAKVSGSFSGGSIPSITQFGLVKMTGTEGKLQNGYTIGKDAVSRVSASLDYITRDENGKAIAEIKDKDGNTLSKSEAKQNIQDIQAERRLVLSPNPRLNLNDEQLDKIVRTTMSSYSESFGKEFEYMYAIHNNTATPHAHIIMTSTHPDGDGIKMYKDELFELKMNFEDAVKEEVEYSNIKIKDNTTLPMARQIGNFIGAIPDKNIFNQNKFLAYKIANKFDIDYDQKEIGNDPQKLQKWFSQNQSSFKEYFMSAHNKEAFLFQDYSKSAMELNSKYDLGLTKKISTDINQFQNWVDDKKEVFLAHRIAQDQNIILQKDDVQDSKKLYKWFMENESEVKEWNETYKESPSKQMSSLAKKYGEMVDNRPEDILSSRKAAREFVRNYTRDPLTYAGESSKSLYKVLDSKQEKYKNEFKEDRITQKTYDQEVKRLGSLQNRLIQGQEISEGSLKRYNINTNIYSTDTKTIELDGIDLKGPNSDVRDHIISKINTHKENLDKSLEDQKIDKEYHETYSKKAAALNHIVSKSENISVSALENIGLNKEEDLKDLKIEKVQTDLQIINFKDTDLQKDNMEILQAEYGNKLNPLNHQLQRISTLEHKLGVKADTFTLSDYKEANKFIDEHQTITTTKQSDHVVQEDITQENYKQTFDEFVEKFNTTAVTEIDIDKLYTLIDIAASNQDIEMLDKLYEIEKETIQDNELLGLKFQAYGEALEINKVDVYEKLLEKTFYFTQDEIQDIKDPEKYFNTNLPKTDDIKHQYYMETLVELVIEKYSEYQWNKFDMDNENVSDENMESYFESIKALREDGMALNDQITKELEIKNLEQEIEQSLNRGNFIIAQELMQDERLDEFTKLSFENMVENILSDENIMDSVYEHIMDKVELDEKEYEEFKEDDFLNDMKKIDRQEEMMEEIQEEKIDEQELEQGELDV